MLGTSHDNLPYFLSASKRYTYKNASKPSVTPPRSGPPRPPPLIGQSIGLLCAAGGQNLVDAGGKRPRFTTNGVDASMTFQCVAGLTKPLAAASRTTAKENRIVLDEGDSPSYIENKNRRQVTGDSRIASTWWRCYATFARTLLRNRQEEASLFRGRLDEGKCLRSG